MIKGFEQHTKALTPEQMIIVQWLDDYFAGRTNFTPPSKNKPVKAPVLCRAIKDIFSLTTFPESTLRSMINHLRQNGSTPILSSGKGYWTSRDKDELRENIESLEQRSRSIQTAADGLKRFL
jgi:hypothetical protein